LKVLITNGYLDNYAGSEVVVRDLAFELRRQKHEAWVYSPKLGRIAEEIRAGGVRISDDLAQFPHAPDIIHAHHHSQALEALLYFPRTPAVFSCLSAKYLVEEPFYFPRFVKYVAIDEPCRERTLRVPNVPSERVEIILNAVDLDRFKVSKRLPASPKRALVYSNYANGFTHLPAVRRACKHVGLKLDVVGRSHGNAVVDPESLLPRYDIVFAKASCALQALAAGNAVVLCDFPGAGPMVRMDNVDHLRRMNFGAGVLTRPLAAKNLVEEILLYDADDSARVTAVIRSEAGLPAAVRRWIEIYKEALAEFQGSEQDLHAEFLALRSYVNRWSYDSRRAWEKKQLERLKSIPLVGHPVHYVATQLARRYMPL
jgi:hypothetical protein